MIIICIIFGIIVGIIVGIFKGLPPPEIETFESEPDAMPYYIDEEITAIYKQLDANHKIINSYISKLEYTSDTDTINAYNKRIADLEYKNARLEQKVYKLLEKWEN